MKRLCHVLIPLHCITVMLKSLILVILCFSGSFKWDQCTWEGPIPYLELFWVGPFEKKHPVWWICRLVSYISKQWLSGCRWIANAPLRSHSSRQYRTHPPQRRGEAPTMVEMALACASRSDSFIPDDPISISAFDSNHFQEEEWSNGCSNTGPVNIFLGQCNVASKNV